jgi:hypothetical protein
VEVWLFNTNSQKDSGRWDAIIGSNHSNPKNFMRLRTGAAAGTHISTYSSALQNGAFDGVCAPPDNVQCSQCGDGQCVDPEFAPMGNSECDANMLNAGGVMCPEDCGASVC